MLNETGSSNTPSFVAFTEHELLIGNSAQEQLPDNPLNTLYHIKRILGLSFDDPYLQNEIKLWPFKVIAKEDSELSTALVSV